MHNERAIHNGGSTRPDRWAVAIVGVDSGQESVQPPTGGSALM